MRALIIVDVQNDFLEWMGVLWLAASSLNPKVDLHSQPRIFFRNYSRVSTVHNCKQFTYRLVALCSRTSAQPTCSPAPAQPSRQRWSVSLRPTTESPRWLWGALRSVLNSLRGRIILSDDDDNEPKRSFLKKKKKNVESCKVWSPKPPRSLSVFMGLLKLKDDRPINPAVHLQWALAGNASTGNAGEAMDLDDAAPPVNKDEGPKAIQPIQLKAKAAPKPKAAAPKPKAAAPKPKAAPKAKAAAKAAAVADQPNGDAVFPAYQAGSFNAHRLEWIRVYREEYGADWTNASQEWKTSHRRAELLQNVSESEKKRRRF